jgi:hypothetical protein
VPISDVEAKRVQRLLDEFCDARVPVAVRSQLQLAARQEGNGFVLFERRPGFRRKDWVEIPVAKFRFFVGEQEWALYARNRHERWFLYDLIDRSSRIEVLLNEVDRDPTGIFWG